MNHFARYTYPRPGTADVALPTGSDAFVLLEIDDVQHIGAARYIGHFWNNQNGTLTVQWYDTTAGTWRNVSSDAVALTSTVTNKVNVLVAPYRRIRVVWTNGGTNQTQFEVHHGFTSDIAAVT